MDLEGYLKEKLIFYPKSSKLEAKKMEEEHFTDIADSEDIFPVTLRLFVSVFLVRLQILVGMQ